MSTGKTEITQCDRRLGSSQFRGGTDTRSGGNEATQRKPMCSAAISAVWEAGLCPGRGRYGNCRTGYTATGGRGLDHSVVGAGSEVRVVLGSACPAASWTSRRLARASRLSVFLQPNRAGGVLTKERAFADVAAKHRGSLVARLLGDAALGDPGSSSRGRKAGPQRVSGHLAGSSPVRAAWRFNTSATAWALSRVVPMWPWQSTGRKAAPSMMPETLSTPNSGPYGTRSAPGTPSGRDSV